MSVFSFIASDYELPEVENSKVKIITVEEAIKLGMQSNKMMPWESMNPEDKLLIVNDESDLDELEIKQVPEYDENVSWYTNKPFIYSVEFRYNNERGNQLLEYLKENIVEDHQLELWHVWLDDQQDIQPHYYNYQEISVEALQQMYDNRGKNFVNHSCIIISK